MATHATHWTALGMLAMVASAPAFAQTAVQADSLDRLERAFWRCDHAITRGVLVGSSAVECSVVYKALKARRFDGDFTALLAWWRGRPVASGCCPADG